MTEKLQLSQEVVVLVDYLLNIGAKPKFISATKIQIYCWQMHLKTIEHLIKKLGRNISIEVIVLDEDGPIKGTIIDNMPKEDLVVGP